MDKKAIENALIDEEIKRRKTINEANAKAQELMLKNVDVLLALVPKHECTSCSDDESRNYYTDHGRARCTRCALLNAKKFGITDFVPQISLVEETILEVDPKRLRVSIVET